MAESTTYNFKVEMSCKGCSGAVERKLNNVKKQNENLEDFTVDLKEQLLTVTAKPGLDADGIMAEVDKTNKKINQLDENGKLIPRPGEDENGIPIAKPDDA